MADIFDDEKRSNIMSRVRSKGNKSTELRVIKLFEDRGITGWRRHYKVKGHPDFVFLKERVAVFVDGCFWHGHECRNIHPKDNEEYWNKKRQRNIQHDLEITEYFQKRGWTVVRIWECELKKKNETIALEKLHVVLEKKKKQNMKEGILYE